MTITLDNDMRRALGLAIQILEDMPEWLQPYSNMLDMAKLLDGKSCGRDGYILAEAVGIAIAWRGYEVANAEPCGPEVSVKRYEGFGALFRVAKRVDAQVLSMSYAGMCDRIARGKDDKNHPGNNGDRRRFLAESA